VVASPPPAPRPNPVDELPENEKPIQVPDELLFLADAMQKNQAAPATRNRAAPSGAPYIKPDDPLREAILASHRWLENGNEDHYTIQLMLLKDPKGLEKLVDQLTAIQPSPGEMDLKVFRLKDGKILVYLNECPSSTACEALLRRLPVELRANHPTIRTLARLKSTVRKLAMAASGHTG
ncbi:MAG: hypothetical protein HQL95_10700, partial [Magnetococcales bacterium]|nr:hypothetical protein [Magnetococcales bacterium]